MARFLKSRQKAKGMSPGSLIFIGKQKMDKSRIRLIQYNNENLKETELKTIDKSLSVPENQVTWINIDGIHNTALIEKTGEIFAISPLTLENILNTGQRPKYWEDEKHIIIILKALYFDQETYTSDTEQISFVLGKNYLITFQEKVGDHFDPIRERIRKNVGRLRTSGADYLLFALMDTIVDNYLINIEQLGQAIENFENELSNPHKGVADQIFHFKKEITYIRKNIRPLKEVMTRFIKSDSELLSEKTHRFLLELDDLSTQTLEAIDIYYTMVADQLNIFNTNVSNGVNDVMKVLTVFASIFIPLTFIAGIYGTNFDYLPELHYQYSYYVMWGIMILIAISMLVYFKRKKWF